MEDSTNPAGSPDPADRSEIRLLEARLAAEIAESARLRKELDVRNCALDAAASHFIIGDATRPGWPVVYVNRAITRDYGPKIVVKSKFGGKNVTAGSSAEA